MTETAAPKRHDTVNTLTCCERCRKAELAGRARRLPVFRYDKVEAAARPSTYDVYHGDRHVATLSRQSTSGPSSYEVLLNAEIADQALAAGSLRDARTLAEDTYIASWREGIPALRGPVREA